MIRFFLIFLSFVLYGNLSYVINDILVFILINIAFFSIIKEKKIQFVDYSIFIVSSLIIEILVGLPLFISSSIIILPIFLLSYLINNLSIHYFFHSLVIFIFSVIAIFLLDQTAIERVLNIQYSLIILILISLYLGLINRGKE